MEEERIRAAIKATEYKYFGDYELSDDQREAVDTLVAAAEELLAFKAGRCGEHSPRLTQGEGESRKSPPTSAGEGR